MKNTMPAGDESPRTYITTGPAARPKGLARRLRLRAASPDAVLAVVPHLLGFYPSRSLVVLGLGERNRVMVTFRYDLPDPPEDQLAEDIAEHARYVLNRERLSSAMLIGYGGEDLVGPVVARVVDTLLAAGVRLPEVLRAEAGRYWSMLCADPDCCPPEGVAYDPGSHPAAAALTEAGLSAHPDRDALVRTLQRSAGTSGQVRKATAAARERLTRVTGQAAAAGDHDPRLRIARIGRARVQHAMRLYRAGGEITDKYQLAWLALALADLRVRDDAWARMDPKHCHDHCRLWTDVVRAAATDYLPAPASLLAFGAWQAGNGALATVALDRALAADPGYSMAQLLAGAIEAALPPSAARMPMTPAEVAASYATVPPAGRSRTAGPGRKARAGGRARAAGGADQPGARSRSRAAPGRRPARPTLRR